MVTERGNISDGIYTHRGYDIIKDEQGIGIDGHPEIFKTWNDVREFINKILDDTNKKKTCDCWILERNLTRNRSRIIIIEMEVIKMANKEKQNLRYAKACQRLNKKSYKGLTAEQKKYIKAKEAYEQSEKDMNDFWITAPRLESGAVDWDNMTDAQLDYFEFISKKHERNSKRLSKLEGSGIDVEYTLILFRELNCNSVCF